MKLEQSAPNRPGAGEVPQEFFEQLSPHESSALLFFGGAHGAFAAPDLPFLLCYHRCHVASLALDLSLCGYFSG